MKMRMTTVMLSDEDRALVDRLRVIVNRRFGVSTTAAVIRFALRRASADAEKRRS